MSDIAFLLLIFFLVTTIFVLEEGIPMVLPGQSPPKKTKRDNLLRIQTHASGAITMGDDVLGLRQLRAAVEHRISSNEKLVIVIESHPDSEYGLMIDVLDELRLAGARRVSLKQTESVALR
jgi:biopolymer transport protein ExbD